MDIQVCPMFIESCKYKFFFKFLAKDFQIFFSSAVSYNNQKLKLHWGDERVKVNPELKLLQYFMDHRLKLEEKDSFTNERSGK